MVPEVEPVAASFQGLVVDGLVLPDAELVPPSPTVVVEVSPEFLLSDVGELASEGGADCVLSVSDVSLLLLEPPQLARYIVGASNKAATHCFDHFIFIRFND